MAIGPLMIDIAGTSLTEEDKAVIQDPLVGGVIYFARNYESTEQISRLTKDIRQLSPELLIAVDQEGGRVQRFKKGFTRLPAMQQFLPLYREQPDTTLRLVEDCGWLMAVELLTVGIDFSFAPVLDVDDNQCDVIADRSFSNDPNEVSILAQAFMAGMHSAGMATTGKHFPGHGSVIEDSHKELPYDFRHLEAVQSHDLIPFVKLLPTLNAVMPAHIIFPEVDSASVGFSHYWLQTILRQQMNFEGVIFSDDLSMEGAAAIGGYLKRAQAAQSAGCDMLLVCNNRGGVSDILKAGLPTKNKEQQQKRRLSMRAKQQWNDGQLQIHPRYEQTQSTLSAMIATP